MARHSRLDFDTRHRSRKRALGLASLCVLAYSGPASYAQVVPVAVDPVRTEPVITARYNSLVDRQELAFRDGDDGLYAKPVGQLDFGFPLESYAWEGFDQSFRTYCIEPLMPIYAGRTYTFAVEPLGRPEQFGLPDTDDGRAEAERRAVMVRELYGRFYADLTDRPEIAGPAFQTALWELFREREFPDGPMPFNLSTGTFRQNYPDVDAVPEFAALAQSYLGDLTGDDTLFFDNPDLFGRELVVLSDVESMNGMPIQAQLGLRESLVSAAADSFGGLGGAQGLGSIGSGSGGGISPGLGLGGAPLLGGGGGGGLGGGAGGGQNPPGSAPSGISPIATLPGDAGGGNQSPQVGETPPLFPPIGPPTFPPGNPPIGPPPTNPPIGPPPTNPPIGPPPTNPPVNPPPVNPPPEAVPAPPAAVLGAIAGIVLLARRTRRRG